MNKSFMENLFSFEHLEGFLSLPLTPLHHLKNLPVLGIGYMGLSCGRIRDYMFRPTLCKILRASGDVEKLTYHERLGYVGTYEWNSAYVKG